MSRFSVTNPLKGITFLAVFVCLVGLGIVLGARSGRSDTVSRLDGKAAQPRTSITAVPIATPETAEPQATPVPEMPEQIKFKFLFEHLANIKDKPGILRDYQAKTGLPDGAFDELVQLAIEHEQQASVIDKQAKIIIDNFHAQYPRRLPPGMAPPPPPQELLDLQDQRDALSLRYRDRLKGMLRDETYAGLKQFMDTEFAPRRSDVQVPKPIHPLPLKKEDK